MIAYCILEKHESLLFITVAGGNMGVMVILKFAPKSLKGIGYLISIAFD